MGRALAGIQLIEAPAILKSGSPGEPRLIARWLDRAASDNRFEGAQEPHYLAQAGVFVSSQQSCATGDRRYRRPARCRRLLCVWATRGAGAGPALPLRGTVAQSSRPAVADIFGAGRDATVAITSAVPIPDR